MSNGNFKPAPPPKTALSEYKLTLTAPPAQGATKPATLRCSVVKNQPRLDVYTNVPNDKQNGNIRAAMDAMTFYALIGLLREVADGPADKSWKIDNKNFTFFGGQRSDAPKIVSTTVVGKDKEGRVFISVIAKDRPYIKFIFSPGDWHMLRSSDGGELSEAEVSVYYAKAYANLMENLVANVLDTNYVEPEPRDNSQRGGNNNRGQGGGNNYQQRDNNYQQNNNSGSGDSEWGDEFPM